MNVLLIHPVYKPYKLTEPLGLCYISSYLNSKGINTSIIDPRIKSMNLKETISYLKDKVSNVSLIGISCTDYYHNEIIETIKGLRDIGYKNHISLGGFGPTTNPTEFANMGANSVIIGEGEITFYELCQKIMKNEDWATVDGIVYKKNENIIFNKKRELLEDLDILPNPSREIYEKSINIYSKSFISPQIQGSRGCYMKCSFCSTPDYLKGQGGAVYRIRSIKSIVDEIEYLSKKYNISDFEFVDDNFLPPNKIDALNRAKEFNCELKKRGLKISFFIQFRPEYVSDEVLINLKEAGMTRLFLGLESINKEDLKLYNRTYTPEQVFYAFETLFKHGYSADFSSSHRLRYGYINFNPLSTLDSLENTGKFFEKYGLTYKKLSKKLILFDNNRTTIYNKIMKEFPEFSENNTFKHHRVEVFYNYLSLYFKKYSVKRDECRVIEKTFRKTNTKSKDLDFIIKIRKELDLNAFKVYMKGIELARKSDYELALELYFNEEKAILEKFLSENKKEIEQIFKKLNIKETSDMFF